MMSIEALKDAGSVIRSINAGKANALTIGGETVFWQREEWVRWALDEVLPLIDQAIAEAEKQEPVAFDVTLTEEESEFLRDTIGVDDVSPIRLTVGDGHSGHGLYVSNADYQEEGSALIVNTRSQPKQLTIAQLREHWQVAKVFDMTYAEIDFADYLLIARDVETLYGITSDMKQEHVAKTAKQRHEENT